MKRVLIVDDAIELGRLLQDTLKTVNPEISTSVVPSAEDTLLESTRLVIDLLITDLRLPGMTGTELIRKIRVRQPKVKVILMTGMVQDERLNRQKEEARPDIFLRKPITAGDFIEAVDGLLDLAAPPPPVIAAPESEQESVLRELASLLPGEPVASKQKTAPLRKGTGMLSMPAAPVQGQAAEGLAGILSHLRGSLGALSALLLDERGHPVAQAGELPDPAIEEQLIAPLMAALSAGGKISYLLGQTTTQSVQAYRGAGLDIVAAPVGHCALLVVLRPSRSTTRLALAFEETLNAQAELGAVLEAMGLHVATPVEAGAPETLLPAVETEAVHGEAIPAEIIDTPLGQDPSLDKFEDLFTRKQTGQLHLQDPDDFWEQVSAGEHGGITQPGVLSFDQAQKLGLVPEDKQE